MQGSRAVLLTLMWVWFSKISGAEVQMRVRPGDNVTIYSDCVWKLGNHTVWFRKSSCECQPPLKMISTEVWKNGVNSHYVIEWNPSNKTHDLLVKNVSESDLGLYYCAILDRKVIDNKKEAIQQKEIYHYGNRTTRLSLLVPYFSLTQTTSTPPVSDCSICWKLLVSVCLVCVLISSLISICVYCICRTRTKAAAEGGHWKNKGQSRKSSKHEKVEDDEVCYASLDLPSKGQKRLKKKNRRVESSDFSTYSEVKTERL